VPLTISSYYYEIGITIGNGPIEPAWLPLLVILTQSLKYLPEPEITTELEE
jgi:hypothetical protein